jgi:hypothetical protein
MSIESDGFVSIDRKIRSGSDGSPAERSGSGAEK